MSPKRPAAKPATPMLRGRFEAGPSEAMERINPSIDFDKRLYAEDIAASRAHCEMLMAQSILPREDGEAILRGLDTVKGEIESGKFVFRRELEDIHMNIEARLFDLIGEAAGRLHTARSRNDQVATDFKMWVRSAIDGLERELSKLQEALIDQAEANAATVMPGFTHMQTAQPVTFGHHLLAYVEMFGRDRGRFADARTRLNECPLGSAALAGTSFNIDRDMTAEALGFDRPAANSLDAVSDRDFALEFLSAAAVSATHLSRLAEEIVLWSSPVFGFLRLSDAFTTGSSIMPQKRNPDAAELIRAKTGTVAGALVALLMAMKGLPLAYSKDMQEDKAPVFAAFDALSLSLAAMTGMVRDMAAQKEAMKRAAGAAFATATDLADWLVKELHLPFRQAHDVTARIVRHAESLDKGLEDLDLAEMQRIEPRITKAVYKALAPESSAASRKSFGGTAPDNVKRAAQAARKRFL